MSSQPQDHEFIQVSQVLDEQPRLGPLPGEQVIPWTTITLFSFLIGQGVLGLSWVMIGLTSAWGCSTWWVLTGDESWRFLSKFRPTPKWTTGYLRYSRFLSQSQPQSQVQSHENQTG